MAAAAFAGAGLAAFFAAGLAAAFAAGSAGFATVANRWRVAGQAVVDLDAVAKRRATGGAFDPWAFIGGRVPVKVIGILHTRDGMGRLEIQSAEVSGVPVPPTLLQELVSFYSRSPERPQGVRLDETFALPANIRRIEVGQGQAVVVQ